MDGNRDKGTLRVELRERERERKHGKMPHLRKLGNASAGERAHGGAAAKRRLCPQTGLSLTGAKNSATGVWRRAEMPASKKGVGKRWAPSQRPQVLAETPSPMAAP